MAKRKKRNQKPARLTPVEPKIEQAEIVVEQPVAQVEETDYLQQYQYKKQTEFGSVASNPAKGSKAETMKKFLLSQEKIRMLIPRSESEAASIKQTVNLNGYRLDLPKNTYIYVPLQIAEVLGESLKQTNAALQTDLIEGNKNKEEALL